MGVRPRPPSTRRACPQTQDHVELRPRPPAPALPAPPPQDHVGVRPRPQRPRPPTPAPTWPSVHWCLSLYAMKTRKEFTPGGKQERSGAR